MHEPWISLSVKRCKALGITVEALRYNLRFLNPHPTGWYRDAYDWCMEMAEKYDADVEIVFAICAVTSQETNWEKNKEYTEAYLAGWPAVHPHAHSKAMALLDGADPIDVVGGEKIIPYWLAIRSAGLECTAVIDRWAPRFLSPDFDYGGRFTTNATIIPSAHRYMQDIIATVAHELGMLVCHLQEYLWQAIQDELGVLNGRRVAA